ncbi:DUF3800 domain-containing protein [Sphingorhabdus arenilitoris]|uniref:DUF3800 domain-containing protein n=1 Tax=Sphingorhabdus arenilitoris TaxID=1490041 RepID=A0ABV8RKH5_9SPHN
MPIYCDESGGVGRGVMTFAGVHIEEEEADALLQRYREVTGLRTELKGSRIDMAERAYIFELFEKTAGRATVGIAISALKPDEGADRGEHDIEIYTQLANEVIGAMLPQTGGCGDVILDDGRYGERTLELIRSDIADQVGQWGQVRLEESHKLAGLQIADVIANTFFNRALVTDRQARLAAIAEPLLQNGRIVMHILPDI